jgi:signal peptidase I
LAVLFVPAFWEFLRHTRRVERVPSPLTQAPAGLPLSTKLIALTAAAGLVVVLVAAVVLARLFVFEAYVAVTDDLAPQIQQDDTVLLLKNRWSGASIKPGDVVAFHRENKTLLRKVARADDTSVWVIEKTDDGADAETRVPRSDVVGRMLTIVPGARNRIETKD